LPSWVINLSEVPPGDAVAQSRERNAGSLVHLQQKLSSGWRCDNGTHALLEVRFRVDSPQARRIDVALHAVVMQAYVEGVSTRRVDDRIIAMGGTAFSKSEVNRICAQLDAEVATWRTRTLDHIAFPRHIPGRDLLRGPPPCCLRGPFGTDRPYQLRSVQ